MCSQTCQHGPYRISIQASTSQSKQAEFKCYLLYKHSQTIIMFICCSLVCSPVLFDVVVVPLSVCVSLMFWGIFLSKCLYHCNAWKMNENVKLYLFSYSHAVTLTMKPPNEKELFVQNKVVLQACCFWRCKKDSARCFSSHVKWRMYL